MSMKRVIVSGRVQGVNFRHFVMTEANQRDLAGWVRNLPDSTVEAVFYGRDSQVEEMIVRCRVGPPHARVDGVEIFPATQADVDLRRRGEAFSRLD